MERLYTGPHDSDIAEHMRACNPAGPLVVHIAKLFPKSDCSAFDAFGRILSGSIKPGDRVRKPYGSAALSLLRLNVQIRPDRPFMLSHSRLSFQSAVV